MTSTTRLLPATLVTLPVLLFASGALGADPVLLRNSMPRAVQTRDKNLTLAAPRVETATRPGNGHGSYAASIPSFTLKDGLGVAQPNEALYGGNGMVLMVTAPNLTQYEKQKRWEKCLSKQCWPAQNVPKCVVLQDLSQQPTFKDKVRKLIEEKCRAEQRVVFLMDEDGNARRKLGVNDNETVILIVDRAGNVIHHESDDVEPEQESARRVTEQAWTLSVTREEPGYFVDPRQLAAARTGSAEACVRGPEASRRKDAEFQSPDFGLFVKQN